MFRKCLDTLLFLSAEFMQQSLSSHQLLHGWNSFPTCYETGCFVTVVSGGDVFYIGLLNIFYPNLKWK